MAAKQGASPKVANPNRLARRRGQRAGDKVVNRHKKTGVGVVPIKMERQASSGHAIRTLSSNGPQRPTIQKKTPREIADEAYRSLNFASGTLEALVAALFMKEWLAASPVKEDGVVVKSRSFIAKMAVRDFMPTDKASSPKVSKTLKDASDAIWKVSNQA